MAQGAGWQRTQRPPHDMGSQQSSGAGLWPTLLNLKNCLEHPRGGEFRRILWRLNYGLLT